MKDYPVTPTQVQTDHRHPRRRGGWRQPNYTKSVHDLWRIAGAKAKRERRHIAAD